jgi:hypothetical protein
MTSRQNNEKQEKGETPLQSNKTISYEKLDDFVTRRSSNWSKVEEYEDQLTGREQTTTVIPGVIRHTSCPDSALAYYYHYRF